jgi:hypothetical protein
MGCTIGFGYQFTQKRRIPIKIIIIRQQVWKIAIEINKNQVCVQGVVGLNRSERFVFMMEIRAKQIIKQVIVY